MGISLMELLLSVNFVLLLCSLMKRIGNNRLIHEKYVQYSICNGENYIYQGISNLLSFSRVEQ